MSDKFNLYNNVSIKKIFYTNTINPPNSLPGTQSIFYMPIITFAYFIVTYQKQNKKYETIPIEILRSVGYFFTISQDKSFDTTYNIFCGIISAVCEYIITGDHLVHLNNEYNADGKIPINSPSHIKDTAQENILSSSMVEKNILVRFAESLGRNVSEENNILLTEIIIDNSIYDVKTILDLYIEFFYNK